LSRNIAYKSVPLRKTTVRHEREGDRKDRRSA